MLTTDKQDRKIRENRLRRAARRQGLALRKSCRRDPRAVDHGAFWLVEPCGNFVVAGGRFGLDVDAVEEWLSGGCA